MRKKITIFMFVFGCVLLLSALVYSHKQYASHAAAPAGTEVQSQDAAAQESTPADSPASPSSPAGNTPPDAQSGGPPAVNVGLSVEEAYAAMPHRRTVWVASDSTAASDQQAYLGAIFTVVDEAIAVKVAAFQNYSGGDFTSVDIDSQYGVLLNYARGMSVPRALRTYHQDVLTALANERQFFQNWNADRTNPAFTAQIRSNPQAQAASAAAYAAYNELMQAYPNEPAGNKDAFYDYHCALDFF